jgi:hypothetical protein
MPCIPFANPDGTSGIMCRRFDPARPRIDKSAQHTGAKAAPCPHRFITGVRVRHVVYGDGTVTHHGKLSAHIHFDKHGHKEFMVEFAKMEVLP